MRDGVLIPSIVTPAPNGRYRIAEGRGRAKAVQLLARDGKLEPQIPAGDRPGRQRGLAMGSVLETDTEPDSETTPDSGQINPHRTA